ncbi:MAG: site-specific integrase [Desulfobacca sp.]|nr:site-specific integrase [Desulfobacca sp.]
MRQGCRPGGARALKWEDLNLKEGIVVIRAAMDREIYRPSTKEKDVRVLPLHPDVITALKQLPRAISGFVFTYQGKPLRAGLVWETWRAASQKAGVNVTPYQGTRHSLASQAVNAGVPENVIRDMLGHKTPGMTKRYAHLKTESLKTIWTPKIGPGEAPDKISGK